MASRLIPSEYQQLFSTQGMSFLTSDIFMDYYRNLNALALFAHDKWTSFLPKKVVERTSAEGLELFSDEKKFKDFARGLNDFYDRAEAFFGDLFSKPSIHEADCAKALNLFSENFVHYSRSEFFYVDEAHAHASESSVIQANLKEFESLKNGNREKMNKLLFTPGSSRKTLLHRLAAQFGTDFVTLQSYGKKDLLDLYRDKRLSQEEVANRAKAYVMDGSSGEIHYETGDQAEKTTDHFYAESVSTGKTLKGIIANKGKVIAPVTLIKYGDNAFARLNDMINAMPAGNVLVADTTAPELIMACRKASAILTNQGGMMSHAAIVSRELKIPCIVGLKNITDRVKEGDRVEVDANIGIVTILK